MDEFTDNARVMELTSRQRVKTSLLHQSPDRVPVDFLATPEVWEKLIQYFKIEAQAPGSADFYESAREAVLRELKIDCRVLSYDMFYAPPPEVIRPGAVVDWWVSSNRSTPNRMWSQRLSNGEFLDIWGRHSRAVANEFGSYEEYVSSPLAEMQTLEDLRGYSWPQPDWWDYSLLPSLLAKIDAEQQYHLRYRAGSIFEVAWQLRGMENFLMDLVDRPSFAEYIMDAICDVTLANLQKVLEVSGDRMDAIYFYDDVATQNSLMVSKRTWKRSIQPRHQRLVDLAKKYGKSVMYHCDGALTPLLPDLIEMGVDIINPIQLDSLGLDAPALKEKFGSRLTFHGGMDIVRTLRTGSPSEVVREARQLISSLGQNGGYVLASSHHIQPDTPIENILALYDLGLRF
jgi:uroporphyrinogen decarboxylase